MQQSRTQRLRSTAGISILLAMAFCGEAPASGAEAGEERVTRGGIDVSHYQGEVDWRRVQAAGYHFAFAKATQGTSEIDPRFASNWSGMKQAGIVRGAYHFFLPDEDAKAQADHFIATVTLEPGDLPPALDVETAAGPSVAADVRVWLERVAAAYGVTPILYADTDFANKHLAGFEAYPLWLAAYEETTPTAPADWPTWTLWQRSQSGAVDGVEGDVDLNIYRGTGEDWRRLLVP